MAYNSAQNNPPPYSDNPPGFTPASTYQPPPQQATVIIQTSTRPGMPVSSGPCHITCPACNAQILTSVKHEPNSRTHCIALLLCLFICWPCVCLPYCMDSCQNANHYCPNCNAYIGSYSG